MENVKFKTKCNLPLIPNLHSDFGPDDDFRRIHYQWMGVQMECHSV